MESELDLIRNRLYNRPGRELIPICDDLTNLMRSDYNICETIVETFNDYQIAVWLVVNLMRNKLKSYEIEYIYVTWGKPISIYMIIIDDQIIDRIVMAFHLISPEDVPFYLFDDQFRGIITDRINLLDPNCYMQFE